MKLSFKEGWDNTMSMVVEVGEVESKGFFRRAMSQRERPGYFDAARAKASVQTWIDIGPWTSKGKSAKEAIGRAWSKWFHVSGIPGRNVVRILFQR
jgi:hypothetical protein